MISDAQIRNLYGRWAGAGKPDTLVQFVAKAECVPMVVAMQCLAPFLIEFCMGETIGHYEATKDVECRPSRI